MGVVLLLVGIGSGIVSMLLGITGWQIARLWLYLLGSAMFILVGLQLLISWVLMRVLEELSHRDELIEKDMGTV
jgi:hypothetical protein